MDFSSHTHRKTRQPSFGYSAQISQVPSLGRSLLTDSTSARLDDEYGVHERRSVSINSRVLGSDIQAMHRQASNGGSASFSFEVTGTAIRPPKMYIIENSKRVPKPRQEVQPRQAVKKATAAIPIKTALSSRPNNQVLWKLWQGSDNTTETEQPPSRPKSSRDQFLRVHQRNDPTSLPSRSAPSPQPNPITSSVNSGKGPFVTHPQRGDKQLTSAPVRRMHEVHQKSDEDEQLREEQQLQRYHEKSQESVPNAERNTEADAQGAPSELIGTSELQCPPGHIEMGDGLRVVTLKQMKLSKAELEKRYSRLPSRNESATLRGIKEDLAKRLAALDDAIKAYSKPKVFLRLDLSRPMSFSYFEYAQ